MNLEPHGLGSILGIWAHPDDEAYLMGGLMSRASANGQDVACITATLGAAGETADPHRWPIDRLPQVRRAELDEALRILGVTDHVDLGLDDGLLAETDPVAPVARLAERIDRTAPDTVITFGPDGMTGHPDHCTVSDWVDRAVDAASHRPRVLWASSTTDGFDDFADLNREVFPPGLPTFAPPSAALVLTLDDAVLERKVRALEAHASQTAGLVDRLGRTRFAEWVRSEVFVDAARAAAAANV